MIVKNAASHHPAAFGLMLLFLSRRLYMSEAGTEGRNVTIVTLLRYQEQTARALILSQNPVHRLKGADFKKFWFA